MTIVYPPIPKDVAAVRHVTSRAKVMSFIGGIAPLVHKTKSRHAMGRDG